jgi:ArsR family transcriptional regulator
MEIPEPIKQDLEKMGGIEELIKSTLNQGQINKFSEIYKGLADKNRLQILLILNRQPVCVCILKEILKMTDSKLSYHLSTLKKHGLIYGKQQGNWIIYYSTDLGKKIATFTNNSMF